MHVMLRKYFDRDERINLEILSDLHVSSVHNYEKAVYGMPSVRLYTRTSMYTSYYSTEGNPHGFSLKSGLLIWCHSFRLKRARRGPVLSFEKSRSCTED